MSGEKILNLLKGSFASFRASGSVWLWLSGLGSVRNALPEFFGRELVLIFPGDSYKRSYPYIEKDGDLYALILDDSAAEAEKRILAAPIVQLWTADGWYSADARVLIPADQAVLLRGRDPERLFGSLGARFLAEKPILRVISLRRIAACTGKNGPGQYAWAWAALSLYLLIRAPFRSKK